MNRRARGGGNSNCRRAGILIVADHAGHRGGGQEAALRALRHAQDVDSVQDRSHATTAPRTTGKKLVRTSTPDQTTTTGTTAPRTTGKKLVGTSTPDQTTTTGATAPRTTRKKLLGTSTPDQTITT